MAGLGNEKFEGLNGIQKFDYKIGTEIETILSGYACDYEIGDCPVCEGCPVCDFCDPTDIREYIIEVYNIDPDELTDDRVCEICDRDRLWIDFICANCNPCENCRVTLPTWLEDLRKYIYDYYVDGSCGLEIDTIPFNSLKEYHKAVKELVNAIGTENIKIKEKCGGHINISWELKTKDKTIKWYDYEEEITYNLLYFADLLTYLCCSKYTKHRGHYKEIADSYDKVYSRALDKYHCIHIKSYAVEIRYPDSPKSVLDHLLLSAVNLSLSFITYQIKDYKKEFETITTIYEKINLYGLKLNQKEKRYLRNKFKVLIKTIKPYIRIFSREVGIDLERALKFRMEYPRYEYGTLIKGKVKFTEELFQIKKPKVFKSAENPKQTVLCKA